jgi:hypothetical protein
MREKIVQTFAESQLTHLFVFVFLRNSTQLTHLGRKPRALGGGLGSPEHCVLGWAVSSNELMC